MSGFKKNKDYASKEDSDDWDPKSDRGPLHKKESKRLNKRTSKRDLSTFDDTMSESATLSSKKNKRKSARASGRDDASDAPKDDIALALGGDIGSRLSDWAKKKGKGDEHRGGFSGAMITTAKVLAYPAKAMIHAGYAVGEKVVEGVSHLASSKSRKKKEGKDSGPSDAVVASLETQFNKDPFDDREYVQRLFEDKDREAIRVYVNKSFHKSKVEAAKRLQQSVHENYRTFITTSKEIAALEEDMQELRNQLTEVNAALKGLEQIQFHYDQTPLKKQPRMLQEQNALIKEIHWLLELPDELDILTSERLFDTAVQQIERAKGMKTNKQLALAVNAISDDLEDRIWKLAEILMKDLQNPALKKSESRTVILYLSRLGFSKKAREIFLDTRSQKINNEIKKLRFENNISLYINELARVVFTAIDSTCDDFLHCFKDRDMSSGFIVWTIKEMSNILTHFRHQVFYSSEIDNFALVGKCFEIAKLHCKTLESRGLSLIFYLRQTFHKDLVTVIRNFDARMTVAIAKHLADETWETSSVDGGANKWHVTQSASYIEASAVKFVNGVVCVWSPELLPTVIKTMGNFLEHYMTELMVLMRNGILPGTSNEANGDQAPRRQDQLADKRYLAVIGDAMYIADYLTPTIVKQLQDTIQHPVPDLEALKKRVADTCLDIKTFFIETKARDIVANRLSWENCSYPEDTIDEDNAEPGQKFIRLFEYLYKLGTDIGNTVTTRMQRPLLGQVWEQVVMQMAQDKVFWAQEQDKKKPMMGLGGLQQFVLDIKFCREASKAYLTDPAANLLTDMHERAVLHYCLATNTFDPNAILKPEKWYKAITKSAMLTTKLLRL